MSAQIGHHVIRASAGSGKTYQLVNRYIRLLALGEEPGRIIALTFTRKAAGEFLQKIFIRLTAAAGDPRTAAQLTRDIGAGDGEPAFFRQLLMRLICSIGDLRLGTIDGFFARLVGAFPYELGLARTHRIMDEFERDIARQTAMARLLATGDAERENRILQLYKQLTWGTENKNVYRLFEQHLKDYHDLFLESRDTSHWGHGERIFHSKPWWMAKAEDRAELAAAVRKELDEHSIKPGMATAFSTLLDAYSGWQPGQPLDGGTLWDRILGSRDKLAAGTAELEYRRSVLTVPAGLGGLLERMAKDYVRSEVARQLLVTQSVGELLQDFDRLYEQSVREAGSLVFADLPMLLVKGLCDGDRIKAADIVYRLDGQLDHWLIDEFQDTSRIQWKVVSAFVDEVLQDAEGRRSFFYVGDVKQSIYGWRGGDARLFEEVLARYSGGGRGIRESSLAESFRSAAPVLECVNTLFGSRFPAALVGDGVAARWGRQWAEHRTSAATAGMPGYAAWGLVEDAASLATGCISAVREADPLGRGLSCAILMRKNDQVAEMTQALREAGIPASMEGVVRIARDNVVGIWLLAFLYSVARPGERFPAAFLPLPGVPLDGVEHGRMAGLVRSVIAEHGYAEAVRRLFALMEGIIGDNAFLLRRREQLLEACTRFRDTGLDSLETFIGYLESCTITESTLRSQVQVMTVHKAKGLDFDMVIVAGFGGDALTRPQGDGLHVQRTADGSIEWILDLPRKDVVAQDPELAKAAALQAEESTFEALCLLYVAMTRARHALYCVAAEPARNSSAATWHRLYEEAFGGGEAREGGPVRWMREWGDPGWFGRVSRRQTARPAPVQLDTIRGPLPQARPLLRSLPSPSREAHAAPGVSATLRSTAGRRFGTRMHDFLAGIEWLSEDGGDSAQAQAIRADPDLRERFLQLAGSPLGIKVFRRPSGSCALWREKPYVLRRANMVSYGIIDRAVVHYDPAGRPVRAIVYDFKTDSLDPARDAVGQLEERYGTQLQRYREAIAALTGVEENAISTVLVPV